MQFVCYPKCSTCQKARLFLEQNGVVFEERHIKEQNPTKQELRQWYEQSGLPLKRFFNTSGLQYKALSLKDKLPTMTEEEQLELLATDGMLVEAAHFAHRRARSGGVPAAGVGGSAAGLASFKPGF